jgi:hypothetical protein
MIEIWCGGLGLTEATVSGSFQPYQGETFTELGKLGD